MYKISDKISNLMIEYNLIEAKSKRLYIYNITVVLEKIIVFFIVISISLFFRKTLETTVVWFCFSMIRRRTNGFHLATFANCLLLSVISIFGAVLLLVNFLVNNMFFYYFFGLSSMIIIVVIGAVNDSNIHWDKDELKKTKQIARMITILQFLSASILRCINIQINIGACIISAMLLASISILLSIILKEDYKEYE